MQNKTLDFFIFGVARSGTTAMANALNIHDRIMCGIENFHPSEDHSKILVPDEYFNASRVGNVRAKKNKERYERTNPQIFGNKMPRYYCYLDDIQKQINAIGLGIYRERLSFLPSWRDREREGSQWPKGRKGIAGVLEYILFLSAIYRSKHDVTLYSFNALFYEDETAFVSMNAALGVTCEDRHVETFKLQFFQNRRVSQKTRHFSNLEKKARDALDYKTIDELVRVNSGQKISTYRKSLLPYINGAYNALSKELSGWLREEEPSVVKYVSTQLPVYKKVDEELFNIVASALSEVKM